MSSSLLNAQPPLYVGDDEEIHIPSILQSSTLPSMVNSRLSHQAINTMQGNTIQVASSGTRIDFVIPTGLGSGLIKPKSSFVSLGLTFNSASSNPILWTNQLAGTSSLVNRVEIRVGGQLIDTLLDADRTSNWIQTNFGNTQWNSTDQNTFFGGNCTDAPPIVATTVSANPMSAPGQNLNMFGFVKSPNQSVYFNIPMLSGLLNNQKAFPLYLLESAMTVSIYMNDVATAFNQPTTFDATNYTVNNATFNFSRVHIEDEIAQAVKASMREQGAIYNLDFIGYSNYRASMPSGSGLTYIMTPHVESLLGMVCLPFTVVSDASGVLADYPVIPFGTANPNFNIQVFLDEQKLVQYNVDTVDKICLENKRLAKLAYNTNVVPSWMDSTKGTSTVNAKVPLSLVNANILATVSQLSPSYTQGNFSIGFNSCRFYDADVGYAGRKVDVVRFQLDGQATTDFNMYFILIHSACLMIDGRGNCTVSK